MGRAHSAPPSSAVLRYKRYNMAGNTEQGETHGNKDAPSGTRHSPLASPMFPTVVVSVPATEPSTTGDRTLAPEGDTAATEGDISGRCRCGRRATSPAVRAEQVVCVAYEVEAVGSRGPVPEYDAESYHCADTRQRRCTGGAHARPRLPTREEAK